MAKLFGAQKPILQAIQDLPKDAAGFVADAQVAQRTSIALKNVQNWIESLDGEGYVNVARTTEGLRAAISASGRLVLEQYQPLPTDAESEPLLHHPLQPEVSFPASKRLGAETNSERAGELAIELDRNGSPLPSESHLQLLIEKWLLIRDRSRRIGNVNPPAITIRLNRTGEIVAALEEMNSRGGIEAELHSVALEREYDRMCEFERKVARGVSLILCNSEKNGMENGRSIADCVRQYIAVYYTDEDNQPDNRTTTSLDIVPDGLDVSVYGRVRVNNTMLEGSLGENWNYYLQHRPFPRCIEVFPENVMNRMVIPELVRRIIRDGLDLRTDIDQDKLCSFLGWGVGLA